MSKLKIQEDGLNTIITAKNYEIQIIPERLLVVLKGEKNFYYGMSMFSAIDMLGKKDISENIPEIEIQKTEDGNVEVNITSDSNIWDRKVHRYLLKDDTVEYSTEVFGKGQIDRAYYFRGVLKDTELASVPGFNRVFSPQVNFIDKRDFFVNEFSAIASGNYKELCDTVWGCGLHGAPLCFVCHDEDKAPYMSAGLLTKPGDNLFHAFEINYLSEDDKKNIHDSIMGTQAFSLKYDGHVHVDGSWKSPKMILRFSQDKIESLKQYLIDLDAFGGNIKRQYAYEDWTYEPVFCTWHEQVALGINKIKSNNLGFAETESGNHYFDALNQAEAERWLSLLEEKDIKPSTIILDATWQINLGDPIVDKSKFPDLRAFVDNCHAKNIKVILWFCGWSRDGIPDDECCLLDGKPFMADPTNPAYRKRVKSYMKRLLSDEKGCYNADGLKVDGLTSPPTGISLKTTEHLYGFELSRSLLELLYNAAKAIKNSSVIGLYAASPYFADLCDFARTGDLYSIKGVANATNEFRVQMQKLVMPDVAKDTDGALRFNYILPDKDVLAAQEEIGVPCIYQAEHLIQRRNFCIQTVDLINDELYKNIADSWSRYKKRSSK